MNRGELLLDWPESKQVVSNFTNQIVQAHRLKDPNFQQEMIEENFNQDFLLNIDQVGSVYEDSPIKLIYLNVPHARILRYESGSVILTNFQDFYRKITNATASFLVINDLIDDYRGHVRSLRSLETLEDERLDITLSRHNQHWKIQGMFSNDHSFQKPNKQSI
jgi:hypothetical protein